MKNCKDNDFLTNKINDQAHAIVRDRNNNFINTLIKIITLFVAITTIIAIIIGTTLNDYFNALVTRMVEAEVEAEVDNSMIPRMIENMNATIETVAKNAAQSAVKETLGDYQVTLDAYRFDADVTALNFRMQNLDQSPSFSSKEAEEIISQIMLLVSRADEQEFRKLEFALETAVSNFAAADRLDLVFELEDIASDWFQNSVVVIQTMVQMLGLKLLGDSGPSSSWTETTGSNFGIYEDYRIYTNRARLNGYPELYLLYEMLLEDIKKQPKEMIENLIEDANNLNEADTGNFIRLMTALATERFTNESTSESRRAAKRVRVFLCKYGDQGNLLPVVYLLAELNTDMCMADGT